MNPTADRRFDTCPGCGGRRRRGRRLCDACNPPPPPGPSFDPVLIWHLKTAGRACCRHACDDHDNVGCRMPGCNCERPAHDHPDAEAAAEIGRFRASSRGPLADWMRDWHRYLPDDNQTRPAPVAGEIENAR